MKNSKDFYKRIKIAGMLSFIPVILACGPLSGYFVGIFLDSKLKTGLFFTYLLILTGFGSALLETVKIVKLTRKIEEKK